MGLDNGIILKTKNKKLISEIPNYIKIEKSFYNEKDFNCYDICYWRKCWNLRNKIIGIIGMNEEEYEKELTISNIGDIIQILVDYLIHYETWDDESNVGAIWSFDEMINHISHDIINLSWLRNYLRENPKAYCYFYDSY